MSTLTERPEQKAPPTLKRLWVRWVLLVVFVAIMGTAFVNLGEWQLRRLHQREARNAITLANEAAPVRPYEQIFTHPLGDSDQWQRVRATGTFDGAHQFVVRARSNGDATGYEVVTPLRTSTGAVLVDRGFLALQGGQRVPTTAPAPPAGQVTVIGHVRRDEHGSQGAVVPSGGTVRLIDAPVLSPVVGYPLADGYIGALSVDPAQTGGFQPILLPEISDGPHFWYAVQWFMFTAIGVAGVVVFIRGDLKERRTAGSDHGPRAG